MGTSSPHPPPPRSHPRTPRGKPLTKPLHSAQPAQMVVKVIPPPRSLWRVWSVLGAIGLLLSAGAITTGLGWVSIQLIVKPQAMQPLTQWIPGWQKQQSPDTPSHTFTEIRAELRRQGLQSGELLDLGKNQSILDGKKPVPAWLMPVLQTTANCFTDCDRIVELRIYQRTPERPRTPDAEEQYHLVTQLPLTGLEESLAIAPLVDATSTNQGSSRMLPFTQIQRYEGVVPPQGLWFNVSGSRTRGDEAIAYGQVVYYHPSSHHLSVKLSWTSPAAEPPIWKEMTGGNSPELFVNQTIGMEPHFEIYQVKPQRFMHSPVQLEAISLNLPHLDESHYQSALWLARNRLWSTSLTWLQALKTRSPQLWTESVQAQMDLIQWHAQATRTQAESSWASPGQQILANLLDGRWERATTIFARSIEASQETIGLLRADQGRLQNRVKAALKVSPGKVDAKAWGALLIAAQQTPNQAIAWLQKQPKTPSADIRRIRTLIQRLDPGFSAIEPTPVPSASPTPTIPASSNPDLPASQ